VTLKPLRIDDFRHRLKWQELEASHRLIDLIFSCCVEEDLGTTNTEQPWRSDVTSSACNLRGRGNAELTAREHMVICGTQIPKLILDAFGCTDVVYTAYKKDGDNCSNGDRLGILKGTVAQILAAERTILNFIQRLSGVATKSSEFVKSLTPQKVELLDTRKTTPGLRIFEKYATGVGGSYNHRMGLYDRILIKDNHLASAGIKNDESLTPFLLQVRERSKGILVEVEIDSLSQLLPAIEGQVDAVLLDNFSPEDVDQAVKLNQNRVILEASGGINEANLALYSEAKPHFISTGAPVHQARWVDIGLDWVD
jgi:nicotinate-nucleotide pyrophosphorylase (carboxylating)